MTKLNLSSYPFWALFLVIALILGRINSNICIELTKLQTGNSQTKSPFWIWINIFKGYWDIFVYAEYGTVVLKNTYIYVI